jgi:hypothetical protein
MFLFDAYAAGLVERKFSESVPPTKHMQPLVSILAAAAALTVAEPSHDFGTIPPWREVTHTFLLRNDSRTSVVIDDAVAGCSCTTAVLTSHTVASGETAQVAVTLDPSDADGAIQRTVDVRGNGAVLARLRVTATVRAPFTIEPSALHYDTGDTQPQRVTLDRGATITCIDAPPFIDLTANDSDVAISIVNNDLPSPNGHTILTLHTTRGDMPLPVAWTTSSAFRKPERLLLIDRRSYDTTIARRDGRPFHVVGVRAADNRVQAAVSTQDGRSATIHVSVPPSSRFRVSTVIDIDTDAPDEPRLEIPMVVFVP